MAVAYPLWHGLGMIASVISTFMVSMQANRLGMR